MAWQLSISRFAFTKCSRRLPLGLEAPVMKPSGVIFLFLVFCTKCHHSAFLLCMISMTFNNSLHWHFWVLICTGISCALMNCLVALVFKLVFASVLTTKDVVNKVYRKPRMSFQSALMRLQVDAVAFSCVLRCMR